MNIHKQDETIIIENKIYISTQADPDSDMIGLSNIMGEDMRYGDSKYRVDYPGEYEFGDVHIYAISDSNNIISYKINLADQNILYLQSAKILKNSLVEDIDLAIITDISLAEKLSKYEFSGKLINQEDIV